MNMIKNQGFYDLNVHVSAFKDSEKIFNRFVDFGYRIVAVNHVLDELVLETKSSKKRKGGAGGENVIESNDIVPAPENIKIPENLIGKIQLLNRLTVEFSDPNQLVKLRQSDNIKKYHLLAAVSKNESSFQKTCISLDFDIITFSPADKPVKLNRKMYNLAISKNMFFEIPYAPMLNSQALRRNIIQVAHEFYIVGKCKNVILSSSAVHYMQIRGPYDIINLAILFGMAQPQAKNAISRFGRSAVLKGQGRRSGNAVMVIEKVDKSSSSSGESSDESDICTADSKRLKQIP